MEDKETHGMPAPIAMAMTRSRARRQSEGPHGLAYALAREPERCLDAAMTYKAERRIVCDAGWDQGTAGASRFADGNIGVL